MTPSRRIIITVILLAFTAAPCAFFMLQGANYAIPMVEKEAFLMGTIVQIKVPASERKRSGEIVGAIDKAFNEIARIESLLSVYKEDSEVSKINRLKKDEVLKISDETFGLIKKSIDYSFRTDGAFDITVKPLVDIWAKAKTLGALPGEEDIKNAVERVGSKYVVLDSLRKTISFKKEAMAIDLGGVAKGYAADRAAKVLIANGIHNAIVNPGGNMYCLGAPSAKKLWNVGIQHPRERGRIFLKLKVRNKAVITSGDYERFFMLGGRRYSHIIDPRNGYPMGDGNISSTVIADDASAADILATALCILGDKGLKLLDIGHGEDALIISQVKDKFVVKTTEDFMDRYGAKEAGKL